MNKSAVFAAVLAFVLTGCSLFDKSRGTDPRIDSEGFDPKLVTEPRPTKPNVFIKQGGSRKHIVADQSPIIIGRGDVKEGRVLISWALPASSPFTFPNDGVVIAKGTQGGPPQDVRCKVLEPKRKVIECSYVAPRDRPVYKYTLKVLERGEPLVPLDPYIANDL